MALQNILYVVLALYGLMAYSLLVSYVRRATTRSWWIAPICIWLASALPIAFLASAIERRQFGDLVRFHKQAWSFLIGDTVILPLMAVVAVFGWIELSGRLPVPLPPGGKRRKKTFVSSLLARVDIGTGKWWGISRWWTVLCFFAGLLGGMLFHEVDGANYEAVGAGAALLSPTKLAHDVFVAYPVLLGWSLCALVPLLVRGAMRYRVLVLVLMAVMLALMAADMLRGLNPHDMHPLWDPRTFQTTSK